MNLTVAFVAWISCAVLMYGWNVAYMQGRYPKVAAEVFIQYRVFSLFLASFGPIALVSISFASMVDGVPLWRYGWRL